MVKSNFVVFKRGCVVWTFCLISGPVYKLLCTGWAKKKLAQCFYMSITLSNINRFFKILSLLESGENL